MVAHRQVAALKLSGPMRFCSDMLFGLYGGLWRAAVPLLARHSRLRVDFGQRLHPEKGPAAALRNISCAPGQRPLRLWIQAASAGEARLACALLSALERAAAAQPRFASRPLHVLACTCTRQGLDTLNGGEESNGVRLLNAYMPLDHPDIMRAALRRAAPDAVVLLETELWPGQLRAAKQAGIPVLLLNARMSEKSARLYSLTRFFWRSLAPERIAAVSEDDARRFADLFGNPEKISVLPNIKFDLACPEPDRSSPCPRAALLPAESGPVLLFASVREEEEKILLPLLKSLYDREIQGQRAVLIIAPRHMHRIVAWEEGLRAAGLPVLRLSRRKEDGSPAGRPVFLLDSFGALQSLYGDVDAAFVGGSLAPLGGQNFLEAAGAGVTTLVGPHLDNFRWVGEDVFSAGLVRRVSNAGELRDALLAVLAERAADIFRSDRVCSVAEARAAAAAGKRARFRALIDPKLGGTLRAAQFVVENLQ
ncbi:MAG: 3-deoxy-D-manno-octulosonic acid transferase [Desulfovibrio sp.]|jgi:3-deoxy-D-manno-octulosonic-acid transferase|nr:3-deoxy-D-manno-octulosonic acid transferase [Desulfovibrio sp.]